MRLAGRGTTDCTLWKPAIAIQHPFGPGLPWYATMSQSAFLASNSLEFNYFWLWCSAEVTSYIELPTSGQISGEGQTGSVANASQMVPRLSMKRSAEGNRYWVTVFTVCAVEVLLEFSPKEGLSTPSLSPKIWVESSRACDGSLINQECYCSHFCSTWAI